MFNRVLSLRLITQVSDTIEMDGLTGYIKTAMKESYEYVQKYLK